MKNPAKSWTYALVTPDGLVAESLPWLLDKLHSAGLRAVAGKLIRLNSTTMLEMYDTPTRSRPTSLPPKRAFDLWYGLGPGCLLLLQHDGADACTAMLTAKGATDPSEAKSGSIRHAGENALMNLVHCPDSEVEARGELSQILGVECALDLQRLAYSPDDSIHLLTVGSLEDSLPVHSGKYALSVPLIVNRLRLRMVQQLAVCGSRNRDILPTLVEIRSALHHEREAILRMPNSHGRLDVARAENKNLDDLLREVSSDTKVPGLTTALSGLSSAITGSPFDWTTAVKALYVSKTYISDTESAALELSTYV